MKILGVLFLLQLSLPVMALEQGGSHGGAQGGGNQKMLDGPRETNIQKPPLGPMKGLPAPTVQPAPKIKCNDVVDFCECEKQGKRLTGIANTLFKSDVENKVEELIQIKDRQKDSLCNRYAQDPSIIQVGCEQKLKECPKGPEKAKKAVESLELVISSFQNNNYCGEKLGNIDKSKLNDTCLSQISSILHQDEEAIKKLDHDMKDIRKSIDDDVMRKQFIHRCEQANKKIKDQELKRMIQAEILYFSGGENIPSHERITDQIADRMAIAVCQNDPSYPEFGRHSSFDPNRGVQRVDNMEESRVIRYVKSESPISPKGKRPPLSTPELQNEFSKGFVDCAKAIKRDILEDQTLDLRREVKQGIMDCNTDEGACKARAKNYCGSVEKNFSSEKSKNPCSYYHNQVMNIMGLRAFTAVRPFLTHTFGEKLRNAENAAQNAATFQSYFEGLTSIGLMHSNPVMASSNLWKLFYNPQGKKDYRIGAPLDKLTEGEPKYMHEIEIIECLNAIKSHGVEPSSQLSDLFYEQSMMCLVEKELETIKDELKSINKINKEYESFSNSIGMIAAIGSFATKALGPAGTPVTLALNGSAWVASDLKYRAKTQLYALESHNYKNDAIIKMDECFGSEIIKNPAFKDLNKDEQISSEQCKYALKLLSKSAGYAEKSKKYESERLKNSEMYAIYMVTELIMVPHVAKKFNHGDFFGHGAVDNIKHYFESEIITGKGITWLETNAARLNLYTAVQKFGTYADIFINQSHAGTEEDYKKQKTLFGKELIVYMNNNEKKIDHSSEEKRQESIDYLVLEFMNDKMSAKIEEKKKSKPSH